MRRDYFIDVFLTCICVCLLFVCFSPLYYTYDAIVPRNFGVFEKCMSCLYALAVIFILPILFAVFRKKWAALGLAFYGFCAILPNMVLPKLQETLSGDDVTVISTANGLIWKGIYGMVNAPFAALSGLLGKSGALKLNWLILPSALFFYIALQVFRYYRKAYLAELVDPVSVVGKGAPASETAGVRRVKKPEVLGTVISKPKAPPAPAPAAQTRKVNLPASGEDGNKNPYDSNGAIRL